MRIYYPFQIPLVGMSNYVVVCSKFKVGKLEIVLAMIPLYYVWTTQFKNKNVTRRMTNTITQTKAWY